MGGLYFLPIIRSERKFGTTGKRQIHFLRIKKGLKIVFGSMFSGDQLPSF